MNKLIRDIDALKYLFNGEFDGKEILVHKRNEFIINFWDGYIKINPPKDNDNSQEAGKEKDMMIGGISFGEKSIWDEIAENIKAAELEMDRAFDRMKEEAEGDKEPNELDVLVESLLNYKDVLEGKVRELEQENEKLHAEIERQDELIERLEKNDGSVMYNQLLENTDGEARELLVRHCFYNLKCVPVNQKCDCGNPKKQIEELQAEVRDLTEENVKLGARSENLKKLLETSVEERDNLKNALRIKEYGNILGDKVFEEPESVNLV